MRVENPLQSPRTDNHVILIIRFVAPGAFATDLGRFHKAASQRFSLALGVKDEELAGFGGGEEGLAVLGVRVVWGELSEELVDAVFLADGGRVGDLGGGEGGEVEVDLLGNTNGYFK